MWIILCITLVIAIGIFAYVAKRRYHSNSTINNVFIAAVSGVISGVIVAVFTLPLGVYFGDSMTKKSIDDSLNKITIGISKDYCNQSFGAPIVCRNLPEDYYQVDLDGDGINEHYDFSAAGYKLNNCVLLCMFRDEALDAYVIVTQKEKSFMVRPISNTILSGKDCYLLDFSYSDFSTNLYWEYCSAFPSNEGAYYHYSEMIGGAHVDNYLYFIVGNYAVQYSSKLYRDNIYELVFKKSREVGEVDEVQEELRSEILELRSLCKPNAFGEVNYSIYKQFDFTKDIVQDATSFDLLFK